MFAAFWFLMQVLQGTRTLAPPGGAGVAWWAHVGGFIAGLLLTPVVDPARGYRSYWRRGYLRPDAAQAPLKPSPTEVPTMGITVIFWLFFMFSALQPMLRRI